MDISAVLGYTTSLVAAELVWVLRAIVKRSIPGIAFVAQYYRPPFDRIRCSFNSLSYVEYGQTVECIRIVIALGSTYML